MKILISQMKPYLGNVEKNLQKMIHSIEEGKKEKCDVIVFPELSLTGTILEDLAYESFINKIPKELLELSKDITIIFGAVEEENNRLYNSALCLEDCKIIGKHRKIFLSNNNGICEGRYFTRGKNIKTFESKYGVFGLTLGEESLNPMVNKILSLDGVEVIFGLVNESVGDNKMSIYESEAISSSYYNKNFKVVVNRCGVEDGVTFVGESFVASPYGKIIEKIEKFNEKLSIINIELKDIKRAYHVFEYDKEDNLEIIKKELMRLENK